MGTYREWEPPEPVRRAPTGSALAEVLFGDRQGLLECLVGASSSEAEARSFDTDGVLWLKERLKSLPKGLENTDMPGVIEAVSKTALALSAVRAGLADQEAAPRIVAAADAFQSTPAARLSLRIGNPPDRDLAREEILDRVCAGLRSGADMAARLNGALEALAACVPWRLGCLAALMAQALRSDGTSSPPAALRVAVDHLLHGDLGLLQVTDDGSGWCEVYPDPAHIVVRVDASFQNAVRAATVAAGADRRLRWRLSGFPDVPLYTHEGVQGESLGLAFGTALRLACTRPLQVPGLVVIGALAEDRSARALAIAGNDGGYPRKGAAIIEDTVAEAIIVPQADGRAVGEVRAGVRVWAVNSLTDAVEAAKKFGRQQDLWAYSGTEPVGRESTVRKVTDHLRNGCSVVLTGDSGIGKTLVGFTSRDHCWEDFYGRTTTLLLGGALDTDWLTQSIDGVIGRAGKEPSLLFLDDVPPAPGLGPVAANLARAREAGTVLLATTNDPTAADLLVGEFRSRGHEAQAVRVPPLEAETSLNLVRELLKEQGANKQLLLSETTLSPGAWGAVKATVRKCGGLPLLLHWLARFIATDGPANEDALLALLAAWDPGNLDAAWGPPAGLHTALDRILDKLEQRAPGARRCFEALGVLPALPMVFDELIVQALGAAEGAAEETVNECVSALVAHELVLERDNASNPRQPGGPRRQLALRPEVQDIASRMLTKERAGHLQDAAARHYFDRVSKVFDSVSYGIWYELETKSWQGAVVHLLHHLPGADPAFATLVFSDLFLKSIWWWDYYIPWEFCDKFLEAGDNITVVQHLARKFAELRSAYPRVPVPGRHQMAGSWGRALGLLVDITDKVQEARDVLGPPIGSEEPIWWYEPSGILHILKGHCWRFLGRYDNATAELQQALSIFEENGDHWDQAWVLYELAEVALERHDPALEGYLKAARKRLERLERVDDAPEHELAALCHRVEADMLAALGAPAGLVASSYAVAIWETLAFNLVPKRPDLYTQRLCQELAAHTAAWLSELGESSYPVATAKIHELWESWGWVLPKAPAWTDPSQASAAELDRRKVNLEKVVRPPLPSRKELLEGYTSAFTRRTVPLLVKRQATMYWQLVKNGCRAHGPAWHPEPLGAFEVVADPEPALAREFYRRVLAPAFPPDELEPITTFESCLAKDLSTPGSARALVMLDPAGREPIAGTVSYWYPDSKAWLLGYLAVLEGFRGSGIAPHLIEALVDQWHTDPEAVLGVAEVEDPRHFPGPEAEARLRMYSRAGAHLIATDFVQPKVDTDQPRVPHLMLACLYAAPSAFVKTFQPALASRIVANFIAEYFSVAEQLTEPGSDPQVAWLLERASACAQVVAGDDVAGILLVDPSQYGEVPDGEPPAI